MRVWQGDRSRSATRAGEARTAHAHARASTVEERDEMRVEDILNSDTYISAAALGTALNGVYLTEVYKGRAVRLEKTDAAYIVRLNNPKAEFLNKNANEAVEIIKRELGNLPG